MRQPLKQELSHDDFTIRKSDNAKRVTLRVNPKTRSVELVVPKRVSYKYALEFAATQTEWIATQREKLAQDNHIPMLASEVRALKREARKVLSDLTFAKIKLLNCHSRVGGNLTQSSSRDLRFHGDDKKEQKQQNFFQLLDSCFRRNDVGDKWSPKTIKIRINDAKTQWGSCHPDGRISYSWRLMLAPPEARDYVVAHEVAHLVHNNHSRAFWELCKSLSADFDGGHGWMKQHGGNLHRYTVVK